MIVAGIISRVQSLLDDPEGTYVTNEYVLGFIQHEYEKIYGKLRLTGYQFDESIVTLAAVPAGTPDLSSFQVVGGLLANMVLPRMVEWKLPSNDVSTYRPSDGPLDAVRDLAGGGFPSLDSWAWIRQNLTLSAFSVPLDIRITGEFLFDPLDNLDVQIELAITANVTLTCFIAAAIAKARGNDNWIKIYTADAEDALDDLSIAFVRANQSRTHRVGRISRRNGTINRLSIK